MRYCGIEVSPQPGAHQLVTLHERRSLDGLELVATFYEPGPVDRVQRTIEGFGRDQALVGIGARAAGETAERVCDELLRRRGLPLGNGGPCGPEVFEALAPLGHYRPQADGAREGRVDGGHGRIFETCAEAAFCTLIGHRPPPWGSPYGMQQRIAALRLKGVVDADGGLWHRARSELDACAAAYTAYAVAAALGSWHGDPREGVVVLPAAGLLERYDALPPPARHPLA